MIYDGTSDEVEEDAARQILFARKSRNIDEIPIIKVLSLNMLNELHIRQDTYGDSPWSFLLLCHLQVIGAGS